MPWTAITVNGDHRVAFVLKGGQIAALKAESYGSEMAARIAADAANTGRGAHGRRDEPRT